MRRMTPAAPEINYEALDNIRDRAMRYREEFPTLGEIYVPGEGEGYPPTAFILGEAPGAQEVMARRPFVGPAGRALRDLMASAGLRTEGRHVADNGKEWQEANCWLTNTVKFRPPGNRTPTEREIELARKMIRDEWLAVGCPPVVIPVGAVALEAMTGKKLSILKVSGKPEVRNTHIEGVQVTMWPMVHPSYGLRNKAMRPILEKDWIKLGAWLNERSL